MPFQSQLMMNVRICLSMEACSNFENKNLEGFGMRFVPTIRGPAATCPDLKCAHINLGCTPSPCGVGICFSIKRSPKSPVCTVDD